MKLNFNVINFDRRDEFYELWDKTLKHSLDYSLVNLWGWQGFYGLEWAFVDNLCWIRQNQPQLVYWAPVGDWNAVDWDKFFSSYIDNSDIFVRIPEKLTEIWNKEIPNKVKIEEDRGQWEYLYSQQDLANLPGNRFHKKKNHYNSYVKAYGEPDYHKLDDIMIEDVLAVQDDWCQWHECEGSPSLRAENEAINRVLFQWDKFRSLKGGSLYLDGKMIAFSVGESLGDDTLGIHFEKGLNGFRGVYQTINRLFSQSAGQGFTYINRAQDLDEEGLRQAKMTYHPTDFLRKYKVFII